MCQQSKHIKLRTCALTSKIRTNYWLLHRYVGNKGVIVIGMAIPPFGDDIIRYQEREAFIENELNAYQCFDVPIQLTKGDVLSIYLGNPGQPETFTYTYTGERWETGPFAPFALENAYDQITEGKLELSQQAFLKANHKHE